jgi:hypothetical protein
LDAQERLTRWRNGIKISHDSHKLAAIHYTQLGRALGIPVVILTTIVGTTVFTSIASSGEFSTSLQIVAGSLSIAAAVFSSLYTSLNYGELAERHRAISVKYGNLRREIEEILCFMQNKTDAESIMEDLRARWNAVDLEAPSVPKKIYDSVYERVMHQYEEEKKKDHAT